MAQLDAARQEQNIHDIPLFLENYKFSDKKLVYSHFFVPQSWSYSAKIQVKGMIGTIITA